MWKSTLAIQPVIVLVRLASNRPGHTDGARHPRGARGPAFPYHAGQAASLAVPGETELTPTQIASRRRTADHGASNSSRQVGPAGLARVSELLPGTDLAVTDPVGNFIFPADARGKRLLFIAGGTGIAPLRSMIRHALDAGLSAEIALLYSARARDEFAYLDELRALQQEGRLSLSLTLTGQGEDWEHARGRAGAAHLADLVSAETMCFICGPPSMVREVPQALMSLSVSRDRIRTEDW
jgi:NAD(P)H-flavin reductase